MSLSKKIKRQIETNKKQFYMLVALCAVSLLMWGRLLLKDPPRSAVAKPASNATAKKGAETDNTQPFILTKWQTVHVDLPDTAPRDLFLFDPAGYTRVVEPTPPKVKDPEPVQAKSDPKPDDKQQQLDALRKRVAALKLQTTVGGSQPKALINGRLIGVGQQIEGFTVQKIMTRQVIVKGEGVEFRLKM